MLYRSIYAIFEEIQDQLSISRTPRFVLSLDYCRALLILDNVMEWVVSLSPLDGEIVARYQSVSHWKSKYWTQYRQYYHPVVVKASSALEIGFEKVYEAMYKEQLRQKMQSDNKKQLRSWLTKHMEDMVVQNLGDDPLEGWRKCRYWS